MPRFGMIGSNAAKERVTLSSCSFSVNMIGLNRPTACVTRKWAGMDSAWEQKKLEARKILENGGESHLPKHSEGEYALLGVLCYAKLTTRKRTIQRT